MRRLLGANAAWILVAAVAVAAEPAARFTTLDIIIDAGADSFAAYQIEVVAEGDALILSVEGGDHPAFSAPLIYDPAALQGRRIIIAALSTSASLPTGRSRVATLHLRESGTVTYRPRLIAAARADGSRFTPQVITATGGQR